MFPDVYVLRLKSSISNFVGCFLSSVVEEKITYNPHIVTIRFTDGEGINLDLPAHDKVDQKIAFWEF